MSHNWRIEVASLGQEGDIALYIESNIEPVKSLVEFDNISRHTYYHEPFCRGRLIQIKITGTREVLFCNNCGLRLEYPSSLSTVKDLKKFFKKKKKF